MHCKLDRVIQKVEQDKVEDIVIVPIFGPFFKTKPKNCNCGSQCINDRVLVGAQRQNLGKFWELRML